MATAELYRLTPMQAQEDLAKLRRVIGTWQDKAQRLGLSGEERAELKDCLLA